MDNIIKWFENIELYNKLNDSYNEIKILGVNISSIIPLPALIIGLMILILAILVFVLILIILPKKRCINFYTGYVHSTKVEIKKGDKIKYPELNLPEKYHFAGWFREKEFINEYKEEFFKEKKDLNLFAKFNVN